MVSQSLLREILEKKPVKNIEITYMKLDLDKFKAFRIPEITVHGRFQPPLHKSHFQTYISNAFIIAEKVMILITNPYLTETDAQESPHRSKTINNPFTYEERVEIFRSLFKKLGIPETRYDFSPFEITKDKWTLDKRVPNLVNTYGGWSNKKLKKFSDSGLKIVHSEMPRMENISGTKIREIIRTPMDDIEKKTALIEAGYMEEAIEGLFRVIKNTKHKV